MTNSLLPVLQEHNPLMSLCAVCPVPGMCCKEFSLFRGTEIMFPLETWQKDAEEYLLRHNLPFKPIKIEQVLGRNPYYVTLRYSCPKLTPEGRCGIYQDRPEVCRKFVPGSSALCCFHKGG